MGYDLHFAAGIAQGHATLGRIGFEGRSDYAAIGSVTNLAARLCAAADARQILVGQRVHSAVEELGHCGGGGGRWHCTASRDRRSPTAFGASTARRSPHEHGVQVEPALSDLSEEERRARFDRLQQRLVPIWQAMRMNRPGESLVVVPSITPDDSSTPGALVQIYEERMLFLLLLLRQPRLQLVFVTGRPVDERIIDYYLSLLPALSRPTPALACTSWPRTTDQPAHSRAKLLERPRVLAAIRARIPDAELCHLVPFTTSTLERDLALALGIPLYGADPRVLPYGTKTGCRRLFADAGVRHPLGHEGLYDLEQLAGALAAMRTERPAMQEAIVKLNDGVSGRGNALVDLRDLPVPGATEEPAALRARLRGDGVRAWDRVARAIPGSGSPTAAASSRNGSRGWTCAAQACNCA